MVISDHFVCKDLGTIIQLKQPLNKKHVVYGTMEKEVIFPTRNRLDFSLGGPGFWFRVYSMCFRGCFRVDIDTNPTKRFSGWWLNQPV